MDGETKSLIIRCRQFFGLKPGQTLRDFAAEIRELTAKDKDDLVCDFNAAGLPTVLKSK